MESRLKLTWGPACCRPLTWVVYPRHPGFSVLLPLLIPVGARQPQRIWFLKFFLSGHIWCIFRGFCPYCFICSSLRNMTQNFLTRRWDHIVHNVISQMRKWRQGEITKPVVREPGRPARFPSLIHAGCLKGAHVLSYRWSETLPASTTLHIAVSWFCSSLLLFHSLHHVMLLGAGLSAGSCINEKDVILS